MSSTEMPAFSGRDGPGEMTMPSESIGRDGIDGDLVVAHDLDLRAQHQQVLVQVVGERVVVVDEHDAPPDPGHGHLAARDLDHGAHASVPSPAAAAIVASAWASAVSTAPALAATSADSRAGTESATMPAPAWTNAVPSRSTTLRMVMAISASSGEKIADGAAVGAAPRALDLRDRLHRAHLGRAAERARRERGPDRVERVPVRRAAVHAPPTRGASRGSSARRRTAAATRRCPPRPRGRRRCGRGRRASRARRAPSGRPAGPPPAPRRAPDRRSVAASRRAAA